MRPRVGQPFDPQEEQRLRAEEEVERARLRQQKKLEDERERQEELLVKDALRLLRKDKIKLDDISETFIFRKLLTGAFSTSSTERQWAVQQLMGLKGMKVAKSKQTKHPSDDPGVDLLEKLQNSG